MNPTSHSAARRSELCIPPLIRSIPVSLLVSTAPGKAASNMSFKFIDVMQALIGLTGRGGPERSQCT